MIMTSSLQFPWQSQRLQLRKYQAEDQFLYRQIATNAEVMRYINGMARTTEQSDQRFAQVIEANQKHPHYGFYLAETLDHQQYAGLGKLELKDNGEVELGYCFLPEFWGKGLGTEISRFLVNQARLIDDSVTLMAIINPANKPSERILLKSGFSFSEEGEYMNLPATIYRRQIKEDK